MTKKLLKKWFAKNWTPKIVSLLLAIALWFLINGYQRSTGGSSDGKDPFARSGP